jgi:predicted GIY-YIG superfamily endonuclease
MPTRDATDGPRPRRPDPAAVYRLYNAQDLLLYIGSAFDPKARYRAHARTKAWWPEVARKTEEWHPNRGQAFLAETAAIKNEAPKYNEACSLTYRAPQTAAMLRRTETSKARGRAQREGARIRREVERATKDSGGTWTDAIRAGKEAELDYLESTGLLPGYVERARLRLERTAKHWAAGSSSPSVPEACG